jgi:hypothetical protein
MKPKMHVKPPNKYSELKKEISSENILEGFLGYGLFPEKIPNFLTSTMFFNTYLELGKPKFEDKGKDYIRYESMRNINVPRLLAIPNPFAYANLCNTLSLFWDDIKKQIIENVSNQSFKVSQIHIRKIENKKHLFEMNYKNREKDGLPEQLIIIGKQYCVEADISNCFPSIYSHSIPWALVGKENAKQSKDNKSEWFNKIDRCVRNTKNEETNGILIGPHSSNLLSEMVLTKVDNILVEKGYKYIRHIDDYKCYVESMEEAEKFLLDLSYELKKYELHLNNKKTKITSLPIASVSDWVHKLNNFDIGTKKNEDNKLVFELKRLRAFLDLTIELMLNENNSAVLNYAFKVIASKYLGIEAYRYYINYVHHLLLLYPYLAHIIDDYVFEPMEASSSKINKISTDLYNIGITKKQYEACSYSIFWALKYGFEIDKDIVKQSIESNDCIFMTLASLYAKKTKDKKGVKALKNKAKELKNTDFDLFWLFLYETLPQTELIGDYKRIKKEKVTFINEQYQYN